MATEAEKAAAKAAKEQAAAEAKAAKEAENAAKEQAAAEEKAAKEAEKAAAKAAKASGPIVVKFRDHEGKPTERTFSEDVHGENFAALAEEFKATNAQKLIND